MRIYRSLRTTAFFGVCLALIAVVSGCQKATSQADERKAFTSAPDYSKLTPEQKKMVDQFSHGQAGKAAGGPAAHK